MLRVLPDLYKRVPLVRRELFLAVMALGIFLHEFDYLSLLDFGRLVNYSYKLYFNANSFAMWLCPYKFGILDLHFAQTFDLLQQNG